jgi:hypothetical protein
LYDEFDWLAFFPPHFLDSSFFWREKFKIEIDSAILAGSNNCVFVSQISNLDDLHNHAEQHGAMPCTLHALECQMPAIGVSRHGRLMY